LDATMDHSHFPKDNYQIHPLHKATEINRKWRENPHLQRKKKKVEEDEKEEGRGWSSWMRRLEDF
jgi:hypothetical protein